MKATTRLNADGHEILSSEPIAVPMGFKKPETLAEQVRRLVRHEQFATAMGGDDAETFEEADDFDIGDDFDPESPFEQVFDFALGRDISPAEFHEHAEHYKKLFAAQAAEEIPDADPPKVDPQSLKSTKIVDPPEETSEPE